MMEPGPSVDRWTVARGHSILSLSTRTPVSRRLVYHRLLFDHTMNAMSSMHITPLVTGSFVIR